MQVEEITSPSAASEESSAASADPVKNNLVVNSQAVIQSSSRQNTFESSAISLIPPIKTDNFASVEASQTLMQAAAAYAREQKSNLVKHDTFKTPKAVKKSPFDVQKMASTPTTFQPSAQNRVKSSNAYNRLFDEQVKIIIFVDT